MKPDNKILNELQEIAPALAKLDKVDLYPVPEGYFTDFSAGIVESVEHVQVVTEVLPPLLSSIARQQLYTAPEVSYFDSFATGLLARMHAEEVAEELCLAVPVLQGLPKKSLYPLPDAYFASFPQIITGLVSGKKTSRISIEQWTGKWSELADSLLGLLSRPRYAFAMASAVSMIVCIGLVVNTQTSMSEEDRIFAQMQQIPDADLHHYISRHRDEFDEHTILHNISNVEFTHYFDKPGQVTPHIESHTKGESNDAINDDILD